MNLKITDKLSFPAASLILFEILSLLILIPFIDRVVYPGLRRLDCNFTPLRRIGVGLLFAAGSVVLAGIIETERKHVIKTHGTIEQDVFNTSVNASTMSVFYQVPQYILQGTSEALVSVTGTAIIYQCFEDGLDDGLDLKVDNLTEKSHLLNCHHHHHHFFFFFFSSSPSSSL